MQHTGRIASTIHPEARDIVFDADLQRAAREDVPHYANIDRAQAVMLVHAGLMDRDLARRITTELDALEADAFGALAQRPAPRGSYLAYEDHLRVAIGAAAGNLHLGRSRNDINATMVKLKLRQPYCQFAEEILDLMRALCMKGREHLATPFPLFTHRQPALPSTLGHHLAAFASAIARDLDAVLTLAPQLNSSCLGAGAGGGTTLPILPDLTARLLGFSTPPGNSIDCVASRDLVLRLLAAAAILGSNLGRIAETLLHCTGDAGLLALPDDLVGSSSAMPHKRNPFLLEHVQGKAGSITGHLMAALSAMHAAPFTNCVAVGTEAVPHLWTGLTEAVHATRLTRLCIAGMTVDAAATARILDGGFVNAMEAATRLAVGSSMDFRAAHHVVGDLVTQAARTHVGSIFDVPAAGEVPGLTGLKEALSPASIIHSAHWGGGPAPDAVTGVLDAVAKRIGESVSHIAALQSQWRDADHARRAAVAQLSAGTS